jgi:hypothetical protein
LISEIFAHGGSRIWILRGYWPFLHPHYKPSLAIPLSEREKSTHIPLPIKPARLSCDKILSLKKTEAGCKADIIR